MADSTDYLVKDYMRKAENIFDRLKTPFEGISGLREAAVHEIASYLYAAHITGRNHEKSVVLESNRKQIDEDIERLLGVVMQAQSIMVSYKKMGYGDEVYMSDLCKAIDASDDVIARYSGLIV